MRVLIAIPLMVFALGCQGPNKVFCPPEKMQCVEAEACPPKVEVKAPPEIHVKAPPAKVVVSPPAQAPPSAAPPAAAPPAAAPPMMPAPLMQAAPPQMSMVTTTVSSAPSARAIPAIGIDWIRIPFPMPRLFAVPTQSEVTVPITQAQFTAMPQYVAQPYMMPPAPPPCPPPSAAPPAAAPPACPAPGAAAPPQAGTARDVEELTRKIEMLEKLLSGAEKRPTP